MDMAIARPPAAPAALPSRGRSLNFAWLGQSGADQVAAATLIDHYARTFLASAVLAGNDPLVVTDGREPVSGRYDGAALSAISRNAKLLMRDELCGLTAHPLRPGAFELMCEIGQLSETVGENGRANG